MEKIIGKDRRRYRSYNIVEYDDRTFIVVVAFGIEGLLQLTCTCNLCAFIESIKCNYADAS